MQNHMKGMTAIVTGGGRGFGRAIATGLAAAGARVTVTARSVAELHKTVSEITAHGGQALAVSGDATRLEDVQRVVAATRAEFGPVTMLVNNAGVPDPFGPVGELDAARWWEVQSIHIKAPFMYINAVLPDMKAAGRGCIIIVSAKGGYMNAPNLSAYCLGKNAQNRLAELVAEETRELGIGVFAIDPGFVITDLARATMNSPDAQRWLPDMVKRLRERSQEADAEQDLKRCAQRCIELASGRYQIFSGRYMELDDNLEQWLLEEEMLYGKTLHD